MTVGNTVI